MEHKIEIKYNGKYPCLCMGHLEVWVDKKYYDFKNSCLNSGGSCGFDSNDNSYTTDGEWSILHYPNGFPEECKKELIDIINQEIPHGCCGGCL